MAIHELHRLLSSLVTYLQQFPNGSVVHGFTLPSRAIGVIDFDRSVLLAKTQKALQ